MLLPDGTVHAEKDVEAGPAAHRWAQTERGSKSGMFGYKLQQWNGTLWLDDESSELHIGTSPTYVFEQGPTDPPEGWSDDGAAQQPSGDSN